MTQPPVRLRGMSRRSFLSGVGSAGAGGVLLGGAAGALIEASGGQQSVAGTTAAGKPLKIGAPAPVTGPYSGDGQEMVRGLQLGIDEINSVGGVLGRPLQLVTVDVTDLAPENYVRAAQRLTGPENVAAVFSGYCSSDSTEFRIYADAKVPMFHLNTLQANVDYVAKNKISNVYEGCPTEIWYGRGFVPLMQSWIAEGVWTPRSKTIAVVSSNDPYSVSIANALSTDVKKVGWTVPIFETVTAPTADWGPVLSKIRANPPDVIFVTDYIPGDLASFAKQFATAPTPSLLYQQYGPSVPEYMQLAGAAANGVIWSTTIGTLPDQIGQDYLALYKKKFNSDAGLSQSGGQYDLVRLWARAAAQAGDPYSFDLVNKILKMTNFRGVSGTYTFEPGENVVPPYPDKVKDNSLGMAHVTYQIQDLKHVPIWPDPYSAGKFTLPPWMK